jgi:two-component system, chemotaxis family, protein-glutamate methylesterase/glutaminase
MVKIRLLIVDDSAAVRRILASLVQDTTDIEVVGQCENGRDALAAIAKLAPDAVTLDVEMPELDGIETLRGIRARFPKTRVLMVSALTGSGAAQTLEALSLGASDFLEKPTASASSIVGLRNIQSELLLKIRAICGQEAPPSARIVLAANQPPAQIRAIGIASSTGGPHALRTVVSGLRGAVNVPVLVAQHMPPEFTALLADSLTTRTGLHAAEAHDGAPIDDADVWIAPGRRQLRVDRAGDEIVLRIEDGPPLNGVMPSADVLFESMVKVWGSEIAVAILTGMGRDGLRGSELVRSAGGWVVVQDRESSVVWGMPGKVAQAGFAHEVLPLDAISDALRRRAATSREKRR